MYTSNTTHILHALTMYTSNTTHILHALHMYTSNTTQILHAQDMYTSITTHQTQRTQRTRLVFTGNATLTRNGKINIVCHHMNVAVKHFLLLLWIP